MLKNYLKIALRGFRKHKIYSFINIFGLAIGITCCILILLYVQDELNFDRFHRNAGRIYRVVETRATPEGERSVAYTMPLLGQTLASDFPEVEAFARLFQGWRITIKQGENRHIVRDYYFTDANFLKIFDFELLQGEPETAFSEPNSIVLTETAARQLFGDENPLGRTVNVDAEDFPEFGEALFRITGVLRDIPHNSHLDFRLLMSASTLDRFTEGWIPEWLQSWDSGSFVTYLLLKQGSDLSALEAQFPAFSRKYRGEEAWKERRFRLQPLADIHFYSNGIGAEENHNEGELAYVYILALIAFLIALIACINYMNLATARSLNRAKEVGLRKVVGAMKRQLTGQFLSESILTALIALFIAFVLAELFLPQFNRLTGKNLALDFTANIALFLGMITISLLIGFISGSYPSLYLSGFPAVAVLKGARSGSAGAARLRRILVVTQFTLSINLIVATLVVFQQLEYMRNKPLGFNKEQLAVIDINHDDVQSNFLTIKNELLRHPAVRSVTVSSRVPGDWKSFRRIEAQRENAAETELQTMFFNGIDEDFLATYEIELVQGRNFDRKLASDSTALLLNETAARTLFNDSPIGKIIRVSDRNFAGQVVGVVRDFHFHSLHRKIEPLLMGFMPEGGRHALHGIDYFTLRLHAANIEEALAHVTRVHEQFDAINPIELDFLEGWLDKKYDEDARAGSIFGIAAALAILIACVGLFGLSAFMAEQRTKEIGVRKVLGASVASIAGLLSKDFVKLVLAANLLAWPIAWFAMDRWLQDFAYRIHIGWWVFALAGGMALLIALITVSALAIKAALANPVKALRYE